MFLFALGIGIAVTCSVAGDFLIKQGTQKINGPSVESFGGICGLLNPAKLFQFVQQSGIFHNGKLIFGIVILSFHFAGYLLAMRVAPVTIVVPLMATTYILNTIVGKYLLDERVTGLRWAGVGVVVAGVIVLMGIGYNPSSQ